MEEIKKEIIEKVILVAVADQDTTEAEESLDELEELVKTAGAEVAARVIQVREDTSEFDKVNLDLMDVSPKMVFSVATSMIPFLENDDANRPA